MLESGGGGELIETFLPLYEANRGSQNFVF